ncbi:MAG: DUF2155 domain-containing protein [Primorskyibacter sp.]
MSAQAQTSSGPVVTAMSGGVLRALDKLTGQVQDLTLAAGTRMAFGRIEVGLMECRVPRDNPAGDAFALITVTEVDRPLPVFEGWIIASSPALNAMDHARYDVWVLRCNTA